jgi:hypothetical protein
VLDLLSDTREELRVAKRKSYPGIGQHNVANMFSGSTTDADTSDPSKRSQFLECHGCSTLD